MDRKTTKTDQKTEQWIAAWALVPFEWREVIEDFCLSADKDIGQALFKF